MTGEGEAETTEDEEEAEEEGENNTKDCSDSCCNSTLFQFICKRDED